MRERESRGGVRGMVYALYSSVAMTTGYLESQTNKFILDSEIESKRERVRIESESK